MTNGFTGAHSGTPTIFVWPGDYASETSTITLTSNVSINVQLSGGVNIPYAIGANGLFHLKGQNITLNITGQEGGDTERTSYPTSQFVGEGSPFVLMDQTTDTASFSMHNVKARSNTEVLYIFPGITGSGDTDVYINNSMIDNYGSTDVPAIKMSGPLYIGIDNSVIINEFGDGNPDVGVINIGSNGARFNLINSVVWQKGTSNSTDTSGIAVRIGTTVPNQSDNYIMLSGNTFYTGNVKNGAVLYDYNAASTGTLSVYTNSNNVHNMAPPTSAGNGTFLLNGPGGLTLNYLQPPTW